MSKDGAFYSLLAFIHFPVYAIILWITFGMAIPTWGPLIGWLPAGILALMLMWIFPLVDLLLIWAVSKLT